MLIVQETTSQADAIKAVVRTHHLRTPPSEVKSVYRPFWLGSSNYQALERNGSPVQGTIVFLADARIRQWSIIGAYKHPIADLFDLRANQVNFSVTEVCPEEAADVLEASIDYSEVPSRARLYSSRRFLARVLKINRIRFSESMEYHLIHRPYWEIAFTNWRGEQDFALMSRDDILVRKRV